MELLASTHAYCRHCRVDYPLSRTDMLSAHSTSAGVVIYFRCPEGHSDFCIQPYVLLKLDH